MRFSKMYPLRRRPVVDLAVLLLLVSVGTLAGTQRAGLGQTKKPAPAKAAPAKAAPAAKPTSGGGAKPGSSGGTKPGNAGGGGKETTAKAPSAGKPVPGHVEHTAGGGQIKTTNKGEVKTDAKGHVQEVKLNNGHEAKFGSDGKVKEVHAEAKGGGKLAVTHGPGGARRTVIERPDHSRLVTDGHGRGYIEHRYEYGGHAYYSRGYYYHGGYYNAYYHPYYYGGVQLYGYAPAYYYPGAYYGWAYNPWPAPAPYAWGWGGAPWYGYYGAYFAPYPVYPSPAFWLTDYLIAATLTAAYESAAANATLYPDGEPNAGEGSSFLLASYTPIHGHGPSDYGDPGAAWGGGDAGTGVTLTPDIKKQISDEIQTDLAAQKAQKAAAGDTPAIGSLATLLADGKPHIFVAGSGITATSGGADCSISDGDVLNLPTPPAKDAASANLTVLASKKADCAPNSTVSVQLTDVQEMQNHLLGSIDKGMGEMKDNGAKGGLPAPPTDVTAGSKEAPYAAAAPPPEKDGAEQLDAAAKEGAQTEAQVVAEASSADDSGGATASAGTSAGTAVAAASPAPATMQTITVGQSIAEVVAMKGQPKRVLNFPTKTIYVYADMKITFVKGKLTDAE